MFAVPSIAWLLLLACLWGLSFPVIAVGLEFLPPLLFAALRYDVAAVLLLGYAMLTMDKWWPSGRRDLAAITGGGLFLIGGNGLLFIGQQTVPSGVASILQALVPIFTAIGAFLVTRQQISPIETVGILVGLVGITLIIQPDPAKLLIGDTGGRLIIMLYAVSLALGSLVVEWADPDLGQEGLTAWSMVVGAGVLHVISGGYGESPAQITITPIMIGAVVFLAVFATALAFGIYFRILDQQGAFEANLVAYLVPPVSILVGVVALDESINVATISGFLILFVGFLLLKWEIVQRTLERQFAL